MQNSPDIDVPRALEPHIPIGRSNEPITLYSGPIEIIQAEGCLVSDGKIFMEWLPSPGLRFQFQKIPKKAGLELDKCRLRLDDKTLIENCEIYKIISVGDLFGQTCEIHGFINGEIWRIINDNVSYVQFFIPNFRTSFGHPVCFPKCLSRSRYIFEAGGWKVVVDEVVNVKEIASDLEFKSGYAFTHVGRVEKVDGSQFPSDQASFVLTAIAYYFAFGLGRWAGPCLAVGFQNSGEKCWEAWKIPRITPYRQCFSWSKCKDSEVFEGPFPGFFKLWLDPYWQEIIRYAVHWYVEANICTGAVEGSIVLTQTAFELLYSAVVVEAQGHNVNNKGRNQPAAYVKFENLFKKLDIPLAIPIELLSIKNFLVNNQRVDSAQAMTFIRNKITHPTKSSRKELASKSFEVRIDIWNLGLWYLELCLLKLFNYQGLYGNRLKSRSISDSEPVPWASKASGP